MVGSGTTLVEAYRLGRKGVGFDIDPLACLIARAKSTPMDAELLNQSNQNLLCVIDDLKTQFSAELTAGTLPAAWAQTSLPDLPNLNYWFLPQVRIALLLLKRAIAQAEAPSEVRTLWHVLFSSLIVAKNSVANARDIVHSRHHFHAHPQPPDPLSRFCQRLRRVERQMHDFQTESDAPFLGQTHVTCHDSRTIPLADRSVDLVILSPPYCNALDYTRAHRFAVAWLSDVLETSFQNYILRGRDYVGSERGQQGRSILPTGIPEVDDISRRVAELDGVRGRLVAAYFSDMERVMREIGRILRPGGKAVLVVCPSNIRCISIKNEQGDCRL